MFRFLKFCWGYFSQEIPPPTPEPRRKEVSPTKERVVKTSSSPLNQKNGSDNQDKIIGEIPKEWKKKKKKRKCAVRVKNPRLLKVMNKQGMSNMELAEKSGVSTTTVSKLINQRSSPTKKTAEQIAKALGVSSEYLFKEIYLG